MNTKNSISAKLVGVAESAVMEGKRLLNGSDRVQNTLGMVYKISVYSACV